MKHLMMKIVYLVLFLSISTLSIAQPLPFEFTILDEDYVSFDDGVSLTDGFEWDDDYYSAPIGFSFSYMDSSYEYISAIGIFGGLGTELILGEYDESGKYDIICPALLDLVDAPGAEESNISYITIGEPGSRIFKLQWSNCSVYGDKGPTAARIDLQVWLHEATNSIDFRYGPASNFDLQDYLFLNGLPIYLGKDCVVEGDPGLPTNIWILAGSLGNIDVQSFQTLNEFYAGVFMENYPKHGSGFHFEGVPDSIPASIESVLTVYPSISDTWIKLSGIDPNTVLTAWDVSGKIMEKTITQSSSWVLDIHNWPSGVYLVGVNDGTTIRTTKFIRK